MLLLLLLFAAATTKANYPSQQEPDNPDAFAAAMNTLFSLRSGAGSPSEFALCRKRMLDLMRRQRLPIRTRDLRAVLTDQELYRVVLLASIASLGPQWARDSSTDAFLIDERGSLVRASVPSTIEDDVMLCLVCALLTAIAALHVVPPPPPPAPPPTDSNKKKGPTTITFG